MKYRKRELFDAVQWFNIGDHPQVTLYYSDEQRRCDLCDLHLVGIHGYLKDDVNIFVICPGDWILCEENDSGKEEYTIYDKKTFYSQYEPIEEIDTFFGMTE